MATERQPDFEILGKATGVFDDEGAVAAAAPTGVARRTPDEAAAAALGEAAAPEKKWRRRFSKKVSVCDTSASHAVPRADGKEAASATGPAIADHAVTRAAPADDAQPATQRRCTSGTPLAEAASAPQCLPLALLSLRSENICVMFKSPSLCEHATDKYDVDWGIELGKGTFGAVYAGVTGGVEKQAVAIKVFKQATSADAEARRYVALQSHPKIVKLLDVILVRREGACELRAIG